MRIFAYMRFSSENQVGGVSIDMQRTAIASFINTNPDLKGKELVERIDEAKSATTLKGRDGLASIRKEARSGDAVIVFKLDRLGRNLFDALKVLKDFEEKHVRVYSTSEPDMPLIRHVLLAMGEEFSRQLSDRCKRALDGIAKSGHVANGAPYGYDIQPDGNRKKFVPNPEEAPVVQRIFTMRSKGKSHREIVRALNTDKIPSPRKGLWSIGGLAAMLKNETYLGQISSGQRIFKKGHGLQGFRPRAEWSVCENAHEAIIDEDLWSKVRQRDSASAHTHVKSPKTRALYLLSGFLRCAVCGSSLVVDKSKDRKYYGCQSGRDHGIKLTCRCRCLVSLELITAVIADVLVKRVYSDEWVNGVVAMFRGEVERARGTVDNVLPTLEKELKQKESRIEATTRNLARMDADMWPILQDEIRKMKAERDELKAQIDGAKQESGKLSLDDLEAELRERISALSRGIHDSDVQRARDLLAEHVEYVEIWPNRDAHLVGKRSALLAGTESVHIPSRLRTLSVPTHHEHFNVWSYQIA